MSTFASYASRTLKGILDEKIPAVDGCTEKGDFNAEEKHIVSPELIAYLKWLSEELCIDNSISTG